MSDLPLREQVVRQILPRVQTPGQYVGGELNAIVKQDVRGRLCLAFPDAYAIGMSNHGLQVLYAVMNGQADWACERAFAPGVDFEQLLRQAGLPLYSLETFTPLRDFDVVGFALQYELCFTGVLTMLDLGGIELHSDRRGDDQPLVIAGGPATANPEPMSPFVDLFVIGDGEESLPEVCRRWLDLRAAGADRRGALLELARALPYVYVPRFYAVDAARPRLPPVPVEAGVPAQVVPAVVADLDAAPLPCRPVVPYVECVQDRITLEIMRGCPGRCRFCQSTTLKRPLRYRRAETIVAAAVEAYRHTGYNEVSLLSLSTSDYPHFEELLRQLHQALRPLGVSVSVPSLRINEQLRTIGDLLFTDRTSGLTLAPEVARDHLRQLVGKPISNDDLYAGCQSAFEKGFQRVKLYFMCGLPGEEAADLEAMIGMAEAISRIGKDATGRWPAVVVNVSNFVPKPQTPLQWNAMQSGDYFSAAHATIRRRNRHRSIAVKCHDIQTSLLEGLLCRGDRRMAAVVEGAWRRGARFDAWGDRFDPALWRAAAAQSAIDETEILRAVAPGEPLPWDHIGIRQGRGYLEREQGCFQQLLGEPTA